jgi:hypothetical protein
MREVHRYSRVSRVDLVASRSVRLRLDRPDGSPFLDFRLTTGAHGFRVAEGGTPVPPGARALHAVGDSYTMGWGVDGAAAYPAVLERMLSPRLRVLNLGVDGFGAVGATARSMTLAGEFPPAHAVYLFCPNDLADDERADAVARRPLVAHRAQEALDRLRRASYVASLPFALRYRLQVRVPARRADSWGPIPSGSLETTGSAPAAPAEGLLLPEPPLESIPALDPRHPSLEALRRYRDFLAARGAGLTVLVLSIRPESLAFLRSCRDLGIPARLFDVPLEMRLPDEGHFNEAGNRAVAALVARLVAPALGAPPG